MKLATVLGPAGPVVAIQRDDHNLVDLGARLETCAAVAEDIAVARRGDLVTLIERWEHISALLAASEPPSPRAPAAAPSTLIRPRAWLPPVRPSKICCVALNNRAMDQDRISAPDHPAFFLKSPTSLIGHEEAIVIRPDYGLVHPEPELAVVVGARLKDADPDTARRAIFGLTVLNDVTSVGMRVEDHFHFRFALPADPAVDPAVDTADGFRIVEHHTTYAGRYKSTDTFGPIGPVVVTADEMGDLDDLAISCTVDGEVVQQDRTSSYRYGAVEVLCFISRYETLLPGDVVSLGTAIGTGKAPRRPLSSVDLRRGVGKVAVTIEGIGTLTSTVSLDGDFPADGTTRGRSR